MLKSDTYNNMDILPARKFSKKVYFFKVSIKESIQLPCAISPPLT